MNKRELLKACPLCQRWSPGWADEWHYVYVCADCRPVSVRDLMRDIRDEWKLQAEKMDKQKYRDGTGEESDDPSADRALAEEGRQLCDALRRCGNGTWREFLQAEVCGAYAASGADLRQRLVQVAAVAVAWIENIDRRPKG